MTKKQKTLRRGITPEVVETTQSFLDLLAPIFDAEDFRTHYSIPLLAELFLDDLREGVPALADGVPDHLDALLQPGGIVWSLWEALNTRFPSWYREAALAEIRKKLPKDSLYWIRRREYGKKAITNLRDEHPELSLHAALELRLLQSIFRASDKVMSLIVTEHTDNEGVLRRLKNTVSDHALPAELLGPDFESKIPSGAAPPEADALPHLDMVALQPLREAETDQLVGELFDRGGLTPMERKVFLLVLKEQATDKEAAEILGISEGAVRLRLHKARKKLTEALGQI
jgi:RNA polymerase sigma factor (sigma-70 family)